MDVNLEDGRFYWVQTTITRPIVMECENDHLCAYRRYYTPGNIRKMVEAGIMQIDGPLEEPFSIKPEPASTMDGDEMLDYEAKKNETSEE